MDAGDLSELRRSLADAQSALAALERTGNRSRYRPRFLRADGLQAMIDTIGGHAGPVTLIVGAGASMEADLPSWRELVTRVLRTSQPKLTEELRERWVAAVLSEGIVSGAAVAQALTASAPEFRDLVLQALYRGRPSRAHVPGAISQQVAWWKHRFGGAVRVFVGLSFTDPNLTRWIHRSAPKAGPPRIALFSRQGSPRLAPDVREELERNRASLQPIPMAYTSSWTAVEAITRGVVVESHPEVYATRWRYVRGLPLVADSGRAGRIAVGAVTLTSTSRSADSALSRLQPKAQSDIDRLLVNEALQAFA